MKYKLRFKHKLPHFQPVNRVFFVTFRIDFSIPRKYLRAYNEYKQMLEAQNKSGNSNKTAITKKIFAYTDNIYDKCSGAIDLSSNVKIAEIISHKIQSMDVSQYHLYIYTIMPNHVHLLIQPNVVNDTPEPLSGIIKQIKGHTARKINLLLERQGTLWYRDYFDYCVRNQEELYNIFEYIRINPVKANLVKEPSDWQWTWINPDYLG